MAKDNKTEKATPQKRKKSREEGNIARSKDLNNLFSILVLAVVVYFFGDWLGFEIANSVSVLFDQIGKNTDSTEYFLFNGDFTIKSISSHINTRIRFSFIQLYDSSRFLIFF